MNYPVPNFGMDRDIQGGLINLAVAEGIVKHHWPGIGDEYKNPAKEVDYNFAPALDAQIVDSQNNLAATEKKLDHKYELIQLNSDPICASAGCDQYKHPDSKDEKWDMDYPVAHFGMDREIQNGFTNLNAAEKIVGHHWAGIDKDEYKNPAKKTDYNFAPALDANIVDSQANLAASESKLNHKYELLQLESDPICSSAGCDQYKHPKKEDGWDMNYPVAHFGMDRDIQGVLINLEAAEKIVGHHWIGIGDEYKNPAREVDYNFAPELDGDIKDAIKNQADSEKKLNHKYELD